MQGTLESLDPGKGKEAAPSAAVAQQMTHLKQACEGVPRLPATHGRLAFCMLQNFQVG